MIPSRTRNNRNSGTNPTDVRMDESSSASSSYDELSGHQKSLLRRYQQAVQSSTRRGYSSISAKQAHSNSTNGSINHNASVSSIMSQNQTSEVKRTGARAPRLPLPPAPAGILLTPGKDVTPRKEKASHISFSLGEIDEKKERNMSPISAVPEPPTPIMPVQADVQYPDTPLHMPVIPSPLQQTQPPQNRIDIYNEDISGGDGGGGGDEIFNFGTPVQSPLKAETEMTSPSLSPSVSYIYSPAAMNITHASKSKSPTSHHTHTLAHAHADAQPFDFSHTIHNRTTETTGIDFDNSTSKSNINLDPSSSPNANTSASTRSPNQSPSTTIPLAAFDETLESSTHELRTTALAHSAASRGSPLATARTHNKRMSFYENKAEGARGTGTNMSVSSPIRTSSLNSSSVSKARLKNSKNSFQVSHLHLHIKYKALSRPQKDLMGQLFFRLTQTLKTMKRLKISKSFSIWVRYMLATRYQYNINNINNNNNNNINLLKIEINNLNAKVALMTAKYENDVKSKNLYHSKLIKISMKIPLILKLKLKHVFNQWRDVSMQICLDNDNNIAITTGDTTTNTTPADMETINRERRIIGRRFEYIEGFNFINKVYLINKYHKNNNLLKKSFHKLFINALHLKFRCIYINAVDPLKDYIHYQESLLQRIEDDVGKSLYDRSVPFQPTTIWTKGLGERNTLRVAQIKMQKHKETKHLLDERAAYLNKEDYASFSTSSARAAAVSTSTSGTPATRYTGSYTRDYTPVSELNEVVDVSKEKSHHSRQKEGHESNKKHKHSQSPSRSHYNSSSSPETKGNSERKSDDRLSGTPVVTTMNNDKNSARSARRSHNGDFGISDYYEANTDEILYPLTKQLNKKDSQYRQQLHQEKKQQQQHTGSVSHHHNHNHNRNDNTNANMNPGQIKLSIHSPMKINDFTVHMNLDMNELNGSGSGNGNGKISNLSKQIVNSTYTNSEAGMSRFQREREMYGDDADLMSVNSEIYNNFSRY
jgi:hypothetical protein